VSFPPPRPVRPAGPTLRIGLTGPIGCGKTTVAGWLGARGAVLIDADAIAREVTQPGEPALVRIFERFGNAMRLPDGSLDRKALGRIVFDDPAALRDLEAIVHPAVRPRIERELAAAAQAPARIVVIEAIRLVEGGLDQLADEVWLVTCHPTTQRARLLGRGTSPDEADQRIAAQGDLLDQLRPYATRILDTTGQPVDTRRRVEDALAAALLKHGKRIAAGT